MEIDKKPKLILIDSHALIHRAFHALPPMTNQKGEVLNAVYGYVSVFLKILKELYALSRWLCLADQSLEGASPKNIKCHIILPQKIFL